MKKHKFSIHPVSLLVWIWLLIVLGPTIAMNYFFAILVHEYGHYCVAKLLGYKLSKFSLSPYGVELSYYQQNLNYRDEIKIALAGPLANLLSSFLIVGLWWLFPQINFFTDSFVRISVVLALFNLLPAYPLDGGRLFVCFFSCFLDEKKSKKITIVFNVIFAVLFFAVFVVCLFLNFNPTYFLFAFFLILGAFDLKQSSTYEKINVLHKQTKNFVKPNFCIVNSDVTLIELIKKMQTSKTRIFCLVLDNGKIVNLSEKMIVNLTITYGYDCKLEEIFGGN